MLSFSPVLVPTGWTLIQLRNALKVHPVEAAYMLHNLHMVDFDSNSQLHQCPPCGGFQLNFGQVSWQVSKGWTLVQLRSALKVHPVEAALHFA